MRTDIAVGNAVGSTRTTGSCRRSAALSPTVQLLPTVPTMSSSKFQRDYLKLTFDPEIDFIDEVHKLKVYHQKCLDVISVIESSDLSDVREKVEKAEIIIPKRPRIGLLKLLELTSTSTFTSEKFHIQLKKLLVVDLNLTEPKLPEKHDIPNVFNFLTTCHSVLKKYQAKCFHMCAVYGLFLDIYYKDFHKTNINETWKVHIKEHFKLSESHARNLRAVGNLVNKYPKLQKLSVTFKDFLKMKKRIIELLQVEEYSSFWKASE